MMNALSLAEADLHALVDNRLEADRRADVLRRLALCPADRARVEAWQEQNELIRSAFTGITREALPRTLDIAPAPHLDTIADADPLPLEAPRLDRVRKGTAALAAVLLVAAGLGGSWLLLDAGGKGEGIAATPLRGTIDAAIASRATQALGADAGQRQGRALGADDTLPTATIPDLSQMGFSLVSAESDLTAPASLVFHYRNPDAEQLVISVARSQGGARVPTKVGRTFSWHRHDKTFAIAGTVVPERLHDIAMSLQDDSGQE